MINTVQHVADDNVDAAADTTIVEALSLEKPTSFFLYAGAGSGKTRSLERALDSIRDRYGESLRRQGRQAGVITYTNAARDEILRRVTFDTLFHVATIHSFAWTLIQGYTEDIRAWLTDRLPQEIAKIEDEQSRGRAGKASEDRARKIEAKKQRLADLPSTTKFTYDPNGDNFGRDSLSHAEVIDIVSDFLGEKTALQNIVLARFPFLLIDESQDTLLPFVDALLAFEEKYQGRFALGLLGDMMQRVYGHGKHDLDGVIPSRWSRPEKVMNHRSRERIVRLANSLRAKADGWAQKERSDKQGGFAFAYVLPAGTNDKPQVEERIRTDMAKRTDDGDWEQMTKVKMMTLEHHMAAFRLGFLEVFDPIDKISIYRTSFRDGTLPPIRLFTERVVPLVDAHQSNDRFAVMSVLQNHSPLVSKERLKEAGDKARGRLSTTQAAVNTLAKLFENDDDPTLGAILGAIQSTGLFPVPEVLEPLSLPEALADLQSHAASEDEITSAWASFLQAPFSQIRIYADYVNDRAPFGTHQGVKGLQFPRVMVIADDISNRFRGTASYEKLFGAKPPSPNDKKNEADGKETQVQKTLRLLYVTCTRAQESLALVVYTENPKAVADMLLASHWFEKSEIVTEV